MTTEDVSIPNDTKFRDELMQFMPFLRAFARVLCGRTDQANDLAQEAVAEALDRRASLESGSNLKAALFKILRNNFYARRGREWNGPVWDAEAEAKFGEAGEGQADGQNVFELKELSRALSALSDEQREALILVGASGFAYKEAASICDCAVGTIKSRVARARNALYQALNEPSEMENGSAESDAQPQSAMQGAENFVPVEQLDKAALYARRLMGASRRVH